tara:strand:+ start:674 stop:898 length:225 start_codon:yes stop_codon:yes gene_type:complete
MEQKLRETGGVWEFDDAQDPDSWSPGCWGDGTNPQKTRKNVRELQGVCAAGARYVAPTYPQVIHRNILLGSFGV